MSERLKTVLLCAAIAAAWSGDAFAGPAAGPDPVRSTISPAALRIAVVCGGDMTRIRAAMDEAKLTLAEGARSFDEALLLQFLVQAYGYDEHKKMFASLHRLGIDPVMMVVAIREIESAFGREEVGTPRQMLNKLLFASKGLEASVEAFSLAAAKAAPSAAKLGGTDEEFLAILSVMTEAVEKEKQEEEEKARPGDDEPAPEDDDSTF